MSELHLSERTRRPRPLVRTHSEWSGRPLSAPRVSFTLESPVADSDGCNTLVHVEATAEGLDLLEQVLADARAALETAAAAEAA